MSTTTSRNTAVKKVGELFKVLGGGTPTTANPDFWEGPVPWVTSADLDERLSITPRKAISREAVESSATNLVPAGSVVVATRVGLGKVGIAERELCFSQDCQGLILDPRACDSKFVALQLKIRVQVFKYISRGTTIAGVTKKQLLELPFDLPPLDEQRRIVAEIEKQFTRLEAGVAALRRVQTNLKRYGAAVFKAACEGDLLPTDKSIWKRLTLPQFCARSANSIRRGPFGSAIKKESFVPDGYKVYEQQNAIYDDCSLGTYYIPEEKFRELSAFEVKSGDLIISCSGTVGRIAVLPTWAKPGVINQALLKLTLDTTVISNAYFVIMFRHRVREILLAGARGSAMQNITGVADLKKIEWPIPPLAEQERIVAEVERRLSVVEELEMVVSANLQRATRLRQSILQQAFEDKLAIGTVSL